MKKRKSDRSTDDRDCARWIIFNRGEALEFAECSACGYEQDPTLMILSPIYPKQCPNCHSRMNERIKAEELDEKA